MRLKIVVVVVVVTKTIADPLDQLQIDFVAFFNVVVARSVRRSGCAFLTPMKNIAPCTRWTYSPRQEIEEQ